MAINVGYEVLVGSAVSDDDKAMVLSRVLQILQTKTLALTFATSYSAGTTSKNQATITVGGNSADFGIRIIMDSAVVGTGVVPVLLQHLIRVLSSETITLANNDTYTAGDRAYNVIITVT